MPPCFCSTFFCHPGFPLTAFCFTELLVPGLFLLSETVFILASFDVEIYFLLFSLNMVAYFSETSGSYPGALSSPGPREKVGS